MHKIKTFVCFLDIFSISIRHKNSDLLGSNSVPSSARLHLAPITRCAVVPSGQHSPSEEINPEILGTNRGFTEEGL